ncbi:MAG: hypothetical protein QOJ79_1263 [Actinomycetota bacterium]|nr:hypothetical protein [Actinomycetota bacterium]
MLTDIAREIEQHEATAWAACVAATGDLPGNPLHAEVGEVAGTPVSSLMAVGYWLFNRVIALGVAQAATAQDVEALTAWYRARDQTDFVVEASPAVPQADLTDLLTAGGLAQREYKQAKVWRTATPVETATDIDVQELTSNDRDAFANVNAAAWQAPSSLGSWFGATIGVAGFRHYGVFDAGELVSTGALFMSGTLGWCGFGATLPSHRGQGLQAATFARRINDAAEAGCQIVHTETENRPDNASLHNMLRIGFEHIYDKSLYGPAEQPA